MTFCQPFCDMEGVFGWATALLSFGTLTNLELFGMSNLSVILLIISDFETFLPALFCHLSQLARYDWTCVC